MSGKPSSKKIFKFIKGLVPDQWSLFRTHPTKRKYYFLSLISGEFHLIMYRDMFSHNLALENFPVKWKSKEI